MTRVSGRARRKDQRKGVICLETDQWYRRKEDRSSVEPMLRMLEGLDGLEIPYEHRRIATFEELKYCLKKYIRQEFKQYPLLYLAFHGQGARKEEESGIELPGEPKKRKLVPLTELAKLLENQCENRIIHFGACSVMNTSHGEVREFLKTTQALAVCGYRVDADWILAAAFEMLILTLIQAYSFVSKSSIEAFDKKLNQTAPGLYGDLRFKLVVRD